MRLELVNGSFYEQPIWWRNFFNDILIRIDLSNHDNYDKIKLICTECSNIGATIIFHPYPYNQIPCAIEFENDALATWFLLRWS